MGTPIIVIGTFKFTEAWHQLAQEERDSLFAQVIAHRKQIEGLKNLVIGRAWSGQYDSFIVDEYPDMEAFLRLQKLDDELNWRRYWEGMHILGTKRETP